MNKINIASPQPFAKGRVSVKRVRNDIGQVEVWYKKYLRYVDYLSVAQLYLKDNVLLRKPFKPEHIKDRILGHWGTVPGLNFIYGACDYLISTRNAQLLLIVGPGHGAPAIYSDLFAEGTFGDFYPDYTVDAKGTGLFVKNFSWPGGLPSHLTPMTPGSILEGGELGYSLSTAFGSVLDNPDLIAVCIVGDGEAETGPLSAAWHANKFLNPAESGAVLPVLHDNGYKISGPTIYSAMRNKELLNLFNGLGYEPRIVEGANLHKKMLEAMQWAHDAILRIQKRARGGCFADAKHCLLASITPFGDERTKRTRFARAYPTGLPGGKKVLAPRWPIIILRSLKGWTGVKEFHGKKIEGNYRSHGIPLHDPKTNPETFKALEDWLKSYKIEELVDSRGAPLPEVLEFVPKGNLRMGHCKHAIGGNVRKKLKMPELNVYGVTVKERGKALARSTEVGAKLMRDIFVANKQEKNFRFFCPDETDSNKMGALFEVTGRSFMWPLKSHDEFMSADGRVTEMLSEHTLQGLLQGYLLTGRHGMFATYEAFATIVASMVDQYAKFLKQAFKVAWRKPISCLNYLLTSLGWRQEHNGYSHQNPGFVSSVLEKHGEFSSVYFPPDANSMLVTLQDCFNRKNAINVIVAGKQPLPQWLTLDEARKQIKIGVGVWEWAHPGSKDPDVVLAAAGDYMTLEAMVAITILKKIAPELAVRFVNVSELTSLGIGDERHPMRLGNRKFEKYFTADKPIVFNFHGYPDVIKKLVWKHPAAQRMSIHGYIEEGTTTTPFDMHVRNQTSRFHLAIDAIEQAAKVNEAIAKKAPRLIAQLQKKLTTHQKFILKYGKDMPEIDEWQWQ